jgi:hypothetical protein
MKKGYFRNVVNESYVTGQPAPRRFNVGDIVTYEGNKDGWMIMDIRPGDEGDEYYLQELGEGGAVTTLEGILEENP